MIYSEIKTKVEPEHINIKYLKDLTVTPTHMSSSQFRMFTNINYINFNGYDYVDLGLPSGTLWATCNVGANNPWEYGGYYAWGEVNEKEIYSPETYKWGGLTGPSTLTKYNDTDGKTVLDPQDDVAHIRMGGSWHMPTRDQIIELIENTNTTPTIVNNVSGLMIISIYDSSKSIFIPFGGHYSGYNNINNFYSYQNPSNQNEASLWGNGYTTGTRIAPAQFFGAGNVTGLYGPGYGNLWSYGFNVRAVIDAPPIPLPLIQK